VTLAELKDSAFDIDSWLRDAIGNRFWLGVTRMITDGSSTGNVQAITSGVPIVTGIAGATVTMPYENLILLYAALEPAYERTSSWLMNSSTSATLMGVLLIIVGGHFLIRLPTLVRSIIFWAGQWCSINICRALLQVASP
jgi:Phage capsid family